MADAFELVSMVMVGIVITLFVIVCDDGYSKLNQWIKRCHQRVRRNRDRRNGVMARPRPPRS